MCAKTKELGPMGAQVSPPGSTTMYTVNVSGETKETFLQPKLARLNLKIGFKSLFIWSHDTASLSRKIVFFLFKKEVSQRIRINCMHVKEFGEGCCRPAKMSRRLGLGF